MAFKMKGWSPFNQNEENLVEKLKRRQEETRIFSDAQKEKREKASFSKKLHQDVLDAIERAKSAKNK